MNDNETAIATADPAQQNVKALFICYSRCSTCAKARTWLNDHNVDFTERDIKHDNPTLDELNRWHRKSGLPLKRFFNTSGQLYRNLGLKDKLPSMSAHEQLEILATDGMLVKRPIVVSANKILVGFSPEAWRSALARTADRIN